MTHEAVDEPFDDSELAPDAILGTHTFEDVLFTDETETPVNAVTGETPAHSQASVEEATEFAAGINNRSQRNSQIRTASPTSQYQTGDTRERTVGNNDPVAIENACKTLQPLLAEQAQAGISEQLLVGLLRAGRRDRAPRRHPASVGTTRSARGEQAMERTDTFEVRPLSESDEAILQEVMNATASFWDGLTRARR